MFTYLEPPKRAGASSQSPIGETTAIKRRLSAALSYGDSPHASPLPSLPFDVVADILCRLPVKFLLQLRCVCKSWDSLISDPKFAKRHLRLSTTQRLHTVGFSLTSRMYNLTSYPLHSIFTTMASNATQKLEYPPNSFFYRKYPGNHWCFIVGSCHGILCLVYHHGCFVLLWNPSIRKFKELPLLEKPQMTNTTTWYGFGYDAFTDNYKVVAVTFHPIWDSSYNRVYKTEVKVHTLGTNFWRSIQEFPFGFVPVKQSGKFVSGTINWLASLDWAWESPCVIVSLDLEKESYQEVLQPDYGRVVDAHTLLKLVVLRDCLCMLCDNDVWLMKEYGNKESWTKLFTVSYVQDPSRSYFLPKILYIFDDGRVVLQACTRWNEKLIVYDCRNGSFRYTEEVESIPKISLEVSVDSLISPCS